MLIELWLEGVYGARNEHIHARESVVVAFKYLGTKCVKWQIGRAHV